MSLYALLTVDNAQSHVTAFRPISEAARSWSDDNGWCHMSSYRCVCVDDSGWSHLSSYRCVCVDDSGWSHLSSYVRVPELSFSQFVADCLYDNSLLTLYVCVVHRLSTTPQQHSLAHELDTLNLLTDWTSTARPTYVN